MQGRIRMRSIGLFAVVSVAAACVMTTPAVQSAQAQTYKVLYSFHRRDRRAEPRGGPDPGREGKLLRDHTSRRRPFLRVKRLGVWGGVQADAQMRAILAIAALELD
jgi:hypothetical protein